MKEHVRIGKGLEVSLSQTANPNLSVKVYEKTGSTFIRIHRVEDVIEKLETLKTDDGKKFMVKSIQCYSEGRWINISLFLKDKDVKQ